MCSSDLNHKAEIVEYQKKYLKKNIAKIRRWRAKRREPKLKQTKREEVSHQKAKKEWSKWWNKWMSEKV